nr:uncharacterized protein LOC109157038 [Ipomoea trifida]
MFILASDISPMNTGSALRLRVIRAYDIPERKSSSILKSKELVFHDQEILFNQKNPVFQAFKDRYRVKIRVADLNGNAPFLLWDRECCELLGMRAYDLDAKQNKDKNGVPKKLQSLVGLNLIFPIAVRKEQFQNMLNAFLDFDDVNEAESPLQVVPNRHDKDLPDNAIVKRALIDEFSSTQSSKKTKEHSVKLEKLKEL